MTDISFSSFFELLLIIINLQHNKNHMKREKLMIFQFLLLLLSHQSATNHQ